MAVQLPNFLPMPIAIITDETDPDRNEIVAFRTAVEKWRSSVLANLTVLNPNYGKAPPLPNNPADNADAAARITHLQELRQVATALFPIYAAAYAQFAVALAAGNPPPTPPPAPVPRPPKTKLPNVFTGKSSTAARQFLRQCTNYAVISPFADPEQQIRWVLQLLKGEAAPWRDQQLNMLKANPPPAHLLTWDAFCDEFEARWTDPHEAEKALDMIMNGTIQQRTSVKIYNDQSNAALRLTSMTGANVVVTRAYKMGLKPAVRIAAIAPLLADPNMTFHKKQALMVHIDETLMQIRSSNRGAGRLA